MLESERARLLAQLDELGFGPNGSLTYDTNFADSSQVTAERGEAERLAADLQEALDDVDDALAPARRRHLRAVRALRQADRRGAPRGDADGAAVPRLREAALTAAPVAHARPTGGAPRALQRQLELASFGIFIVSVILHEISHGAVAPCGSGTTPPSGPAASRSTRYRTSTRSARSSCPAFLLLSHTPASSSGGREPVPVNVSRLRSPRNDAVLTGLAGPATNLVLVGIVTGGAARVPPRGDDWAFDLLVYSGSSTCCSPSSTSCPSRRSTAARSSSA